MKMTSFVTFSSHGFLRLSWKLSVIKGLQIILKTAMKIFLIIFAVASAFSANSPAQSFIAGWDFETTSNGGTRVLAATATPKVYIANFGSGTLYLDGTQGSSDWLVPAVGFQLSAFVGTTVNTSNGLVNTISPSSLAFLNQAANGKSAVFKFDLSSVFDPIEITYASQRTATGFDSQTWEWSTDGAAYNPIGQFASGTTPGALTTSFTNSGVLTLPQFSGLSGAANAFVRVTFNGATSTSGNNRLDNVQFNTVPEPSTYAMLALAGAGFAGYVIRRRRR